MKRSDVISCDKIKAGDVIVGLASFGQASYEDCYNSGMGSNGLTSARHDVFEKIYSEKYPESFDASVPHELVYSGTKKINDIDESTQMNIGKMVLSPTRTYTPVILKVLENFRHEIHGMIHCSGGAQTKVINFIENLHVVKDNLFPVPPLFRLIQTESGTGWNEMYKVFNMGHRMELYVEEKVSKEIINVAEAFNIEAKIVGRCEGFKGKKITIKSENGTFEYY